MDKEQEEKVYGDPLADHADSIWDNSQEGEESLEGSSERPSYFGSVEIRLSKEEEADAAKQTVDMDGLLMPGDAAFDGESDGRLSQEGCCSVVLLVVLCC
jgi:hypothetical protein